VNDRKYGHDQGKKYPEIGLGKYQGSLLVEEKDCLPVDIQ
jgi:hypothetical protein